MGNITVSGKKADFPKLIPHTWAWMDFKENVEYFSPLNQISKTCAQIALLYKKLTQ